MVTSTIVLTKYQRTMCNSTYSHHITVSEHQCAIVPIKYQC